MLWYGDLSSKQVESTAMSMSQVALWTVLHCPKCILFQVEGACTAGDARSDRIDFCISS